MKFNRGMVRVWFDVDVHDDIDRAVDELNSVPGVTAFYGEAGVLLVDSFCEDHWSIDYLLVLIEEILEGK